ncbi:hypothetical protein PISL3812_05288 [Talaromyces islandicus]|uniref:F-box domain-containing protein n=1 Tax=Talaromyces islandicus TaxID=28573 RepID=A0A0U1LZU9_TALIS|nr:hypothetical protein PISL3812_05288 [Talaromyces islandicus]
MSAVNSDSTAERSHLLSIPLDLITYIFDFLPNQDLKRARLACRSLRNVVRLRIHRVFISANPHNIEIARAIADDEIYRRGIVEIIWDDSLLVTLQDNRERFQESSSDDSDALGNDEDSPPGWFKRKLKKNLDHLFKQRMGLDDPDLLIHIANSRRAAALMSTEEAWSYYRSLIQQQKEILTSGEADVSVLRYALVRLPALKRITITRAAHGILFHPLYQTPMIRSFPRELNYPIPYGWLAMETPINDPQAPPPGALADTVMDPWRGFRAVTRVLAELRDHRITELVLDTGGLVCGVSCRIFESPCREYEDLVSLIQRPGFRRLDLALIVGDDAHRDWASFRSGNLSQMLASAEGLEHVTLSTTVESDPAVDSEEGGNGHMRNLIPLKSIFPIDKWPRLRHLKLSQFLVKQADVVDFLVALPETLRSVELSFLLFLDGGGNYRDMLDEMRERLASWREREKSARPRVVIGIKWRRLVVLTGRAIWVDREVGEFLYGAGENPFASGRNKNRIRYGCGVVKDVFQPEYKRPYVDVETMEELGYYKKDPQRPKPRRDWLS